MPMNLKLLLFLFCVTLGSTSALAADGTEVRDIEVRGLNRTEVDVFFRELTFRKGDTVSNEDLEESTQRLRNLGLFAKVDYTIREDGVLEFELLERWTILPVFKASSGGGINQLILGLYDINVFGKYLEFGGQYERFGPTNSGVLWFRNPRLFDERLWLGVDLWYTNRVQTLYDDNGDVEGGYLLRRAMVSVALERELLWWLKIGGRLQFIDDETSLQLVDESIARQQNARGLPDPLRRIQPGVNLSLGRMNFDNYLVEGIEWKLRLDATDTVLGSSASHASIESELLVARTLPLNSTIALRWLTGISSTKSEPQYFFVGGFDRIRGFVDGRFRGPAHSTANLEYRIPSLDTSWIVLQHVAFLDATTVGSGPEMFSDLTAASVGAGLRVISPRIYRLTLRLDYAHTVVNSGTSALSFGVQQFF